MPRSVRWKWSQIWGWSGLKLFSDQIAWMITLSNISIEIMKPFSLQNYSLKSRTLNLIFSLTMSKKMKIPSNFETNTGFLILIRHRFLKLTQLLGKKSLENKNLISWTKIKTFQTISKARTIANNITNKTKTITINNITNKIIRITNNKTNKIIRITNNKTNNMTNKIIINTIIKAINQIRMIQLKNKIW